MSPREPEPLLSTVSETSSVTSISPSEVSSRELQDIVALWNAWRRGRLMPTRDDIAPRDLGRRLRDISVVRVLHDEQDYEFRIIGGAHTQAYGVNQQGKRMSDVLEEAPGFGRRLKTSLDAVVDARAPMAYRGRIGRDVGNARFVWLETVFLPLGTAHAGVDHVMIATVYVPLNGVWSN